MYYFISNILVLTKSDIDTLGKYMTPIDIHLISWNRPKMTELVIKAIHRNTKRENFRLVVLDNGSDGDMPDKLQQLHDAGLIDELLLFKTNMGLEGARNLLLNHATQSEYFVCVDNDCLPQPIEDGTDWLEKLVDLMEKHEDYAAISARTQVMVGTGDIFAEADEAGDELVNFPHPGGSYRIMNTKVVHFVGGWDRAARGRGSEERYICGKLHDAGFKTAFSTNVKTLHLFGTPDTDRWGYDKNLKPEDTGHSDISHPAFQADNIEDIAKYVGKELAKWYLL